MSTNDSLVFLENAVRSGASGVGAVSIQTLLLNWTTNLINTNLKTHQNSKNFLKNLYKQHGIAILYRGATRNLLIGSIARFGDLFANFSILDYFSKNSIYSNTPIFIQTGATWLAANLWRICFLSLVPLGDNERIYNGKSMTNNSLILRLRNVFGSRIKPQAASLYFWFLTQNYLDYYIPSIRFMDNFTLALIRNSFIGYLSMISLDLSLLSTSFLTSIISKDKLPSLSASSRTKLFMKGLNGVIFCNASNYFREIIL